jgi:hypothetical protein
MLPNVHYTKHAALTSEYANLRSQCVFTLADHVNNHKIAARITDTRIKEHLIEELSTYQDASKGDGKRLATMKEDIRELIGRSPDISDTLIMRMYFVLRDRLVPFTSEEHAKAIEEQNRRFELNVARHEQNSTK